MTHQTIRFLLESCSDNMEIRFLSPVYLVGSYQTRPDEAKDIDIVMIMTDDRMRRLFGEVAFNERRFEFMRKQKLWYELYIKDFDIDFKVQSIKDASFHTGPKTKLGKYVTVPE